MAYIIDENNPQNANQAGANPLSSGSTPNSGQVQLTSGSGGIVSPSTQPSASGQNQNPQAQQPTSSGSFTNIQQYLRANQDQAGGLANQISAPLLSQGTQIQSDASTAQNSFNQLVQQGAGQANPNLLSGLDVTANPYNPATQAPKAEQYLPMSYQTAEGSKGSRSTPFENTSNPADTSNLSYQDRSALSQMDPSKLSASDQASLTKLLSGQYTGPSDIESTGLLQKAKASADQLNTSLQNTQTEPGRYQLLQSMLGTPTYTSGQTSLDNALLQNNQGARDILENTRSKLSGIPQTVSDTASKANAYANTGAQTATDLKAQTQAALNQSIQNRLSNLQSRAAYETDQTAAQKAALTEQLGDAMKLSNKDPRFLDDYSLLTGKPYGQANSQNQFTPLDYTVDPTSFVQSPGAATTSGVTTAEEQAQIEALNRLLGQTNTALPKDANLGTYQVGANYRPADYENQLLQNLQDYNNSANLQKFSEHTIDPQLQAAIDLGQSVKYHGVNPPITNYTLLDQLVNHSDTFHLPEGIDQNGAPYDPQAAILNNVNAALAQENALRSQYGLKPIEAPADSSYAALKALLDRESSQTVHGYVAPDVLRNQFA